MSDILVAALNLRQTSALGGSGGSSSDFAILQSAVAQLDLLVPRIKAEPVIVATAGQTVFTLSESYVMGTNSLLVFSGSVLSDDYTELSANQIQFNTGRVAGERVKVIEIQLGSDTGRTVVDTLPSTSFLAGEVPTGAIDSTDGTNGNGVFNVAHAVDASVPPRIFIGGGLELLSSMFSRSNQTFTISAPYKPYAGTTLAVYYKRVP